MIKNSFFQKPNSCNHLKTNTAFIIIPYGEAWSQDVTDLIKNVCKKIGIFAERADEVVNINTNIGNNIKREISKAGIVIADITKRNPNVFWELGFAEAKGKNIVLLRQNNSEDIPSNIAGQQYLTYGTLPKEFEKFQMDLEKILRKYKMQN